MEIDDNRTSQVTWQSLFAILGFVSFLHLILNGMVFLLSSAAVYSNLPLSATKILIVLFKMAAVFLTCRLLLSLKVTPVLAILSALVLFIGGEMKNHLKKRTTAAYSTSDSQNQRFFNITVLVMIVTAVSALILQVNIPSGAIVSASQNLWLQILGFCGLIILVQRFKVILENSRTLLYVLRSHLNSLFQGKLKRKW